MGSGLCLFNNGLLQDKTIIFKVNGLITDHKTTDLATLIRSPYAKQLRNKPLK